MPNQRNLKPFSAGRSGNPSGRPKGSKNRASLTRKILAMKVQMPEELYQYLKTMFPEIKKKLSFEEIGTLALSVAMSKGDVAAYKALMDSAYGAPKQEIESTREQNIQFMNIVLLDVA